MKSPTQLGDSPASAKLAGELACELSDFRPSHPSTQISADQTSSDHLHNLLKQCGQMIIPERNKT
jgi:hypothetical protein